MIAVDTNVLIYAHREEMPYHSQALAWLRHLAEGQEPWVTPVFCLGEFIRVVTHPRVFDPPTPLVAACKEHRVTTLLSLDRDFSRFSGLTLLSPLDPPPAPEPLPEESDEQ